MRSRHNCLHTIHINELLYVSDVFDISLKERNFLYKEIEFPKNSIYMCDIMNIIEEDFMCL